MNLGINHNSPCVLCLFLSSQPPCGCPILRALCEGWETTNAPVSFVFLYPNPKTGERNHKSFVPFVFPVPITMSMGLTSLQTNLVFSTPITNPGCPILRTFAQGGMHKSHIVLRLRVVGRWKAVSLLSMLSATCHFQCAPA
jgi:hypothetical protein